MIDDTRFLYSGARVRALEKGLLDNEMMNRMAEADSENDVLNILSETSYGEESLNFKNPIDYERVLDEESNRLYKSLYEICPVKGAIDLFSLRYDYHNLKILLKSRYLKSDLDYLLYDIGTISVKKLTAYFNSEEYGKLSPQMSWGIREVISEFSVREDPQVIDIILDHAFYSEVTSILSDLESRSLSELFKLIIDLTNIRIFVRLKAQNKDRDFLTSVLIKGGSLKFDRFITSLPDSLESFPDRIRHTGYSEQIREGVLEYHRTQSFGKLEKIVDDIIMERVKKSKYIALGVEPIIGYLIAKETEIKDIRIIMAGKINKVSPSIIKERLRDTYV